MQEGCPRQHVRQSVRRMMCRHEGRDLFTEMVAPATRASPHAVWLQAGPGCPRESTDAGHGVAGVRLRGNDAKRCRRRGENEDLPRVGFNLPGGGPDDPQAIYYCVTRAFDAGASGIVVSREYEELTVPNLKAVGRAVRGLTRKSA